MIELVVLYISYPILSFILDRGDVVGSQGIYESWSFSEQYFGKLNRLSDRGLKFKLSLIFAATNIYEEKGRRRGSIDYK